MTKPNEAPSNEQEVLALAKECGAYIWDAEYSNIEMAHDVGDVDFDKQQLIDFTSKLRAKDAAQLREQHQNQLDLVERLAEADATIAQLKEEKAGTREALDAAYSIDAENKALKIELSATKDKMAMLVDAVEKEISFAIQDCEDSVDIDSLHKILSATSSEVAKHRAECDAKAISPWVDICWKLVGSFGKARGKHVITCRAMLEALPETSELRASANPTTAIKEE